MNFKNWTLSSNLHYNQNIEQYLSPSCPSLGYPALLLQKLSLPPLSPGSHWSTFCHCGFAFFRPSHKCLASLTNIMHIRITRVFAFSWQEFIAFYCCAVSHGADVQQPTSIHQLLDIWVASSFRVIPNNVDVNMHAHIIVWAYVFISLSQTPRSGTAGFIRCVCLTL